MAIRGFTLCVLLILGLMSMNSIAEDETLRHPAAGPIAGKVDENGALSWRGIPYAQAPVGELRWKAPRAIKRFESTFSADDFADICTQLGHPLLDIDPSLYGKAVGSEDCLYLNVWSPPLAEESDLEITDKKTTLLPVMVWVHGGSKVGGSGNFHYGGKLAIAQHVVVVTINYRLGLLG